MLDQATVSRIYTLARQARLSSAAGESLELRLSPTESAALADILEEALDDDQAWFWSEAWQAGERAAEADLAAGRYQDFEAMEDFLRDLGQQP
jgi:hypothetical protein